MSTSTLDMAFIAAADAWSESFLEAKGKFEAAAVAAGFTVLRQPLPLPRATRESLDWEEDAAFA